MQEKEKYRVPRKVQDVIPIKRIWPDGIFLVGNKFAKTWKFTDINYQVASREDKESMFLTYSELLNSLDLIDVKDIKQYKLFEAKIKEIMTEIITECLEPTNQMVKNLIEIELSFINSSHPDFLSDGDLKQYQDDDENINNSSNNKNNYLNFTDREFMEINIIRNLIVSYFNVVKKNICDLVPKAIICFLVNKSKDISEQKMIEILYKSKVDIKNLLKEDPIITEKRKEIKEQLSFLKTSFSILDQESNI
jgi:hypothetical protein